MQDMATMQQHSITSPAPASTIQNQGNYINQLHLLNPKIQKAFSVVSFLNKLNLVRHIGSHF